MKSSRYLPAGVLILSIGTIAYVVATQGKPLAHLATFPFRHTPASDQRAWQQWANANAVLFGALHEGARIAILTDLRHSAGMLLEKEGGRMKARRCLFVKAARPGVVVVLDDRAARQLLALRPGPDPDQIWDATKQLLSSSRIQVYTLRDRQNLEERGYTDFLRALDRESVLPSQSKTSRG